MSLNGRNHSSLDMTNGRPLCPRCKAPMWGLRVRHEKIAYDKLAFQCPRCEHPRMNAVLPEPQTPVSRIARIGKVR